MGCGAQVGLQLFSTPIQLSQTPTDLTIMATIKLTSLSLLFATATATAKAAVGTEPGKSLWTDERAGASTSGSAIDNAAPAVGERAVFYVSAYNQWTLYAADLDTGDRLWNMTVPDVNVATSPTVAGTGRTFLFFCDSMCFLLVSRNSNLQALISVFHLLVVG